MSTVKADYLVNAAGTGAPTLTNGAVLPAGSAAAPAISPTGDSNTGIFFPAADTVSVTTAGVERLRVNSSGNVGIGISSPTRKLDVSFELAAVTGSDYTSITHDGTNGGLFFTKQGLIYTVTNMVFHTASTERMRIDSSGNVSITQTPGKYTVDVSGGATAIANGGTVDFANASGMLVVNNHSSGAVSVYLCGGGGATLIGQTGAQVGTFTYVAGIGGYRWTNNYGATATVGFFFVRTRATA